MIPVEDELIFNLEEDNHHELSSSMTNLSQGGSSGPAPIKHQNSLPTGKYRNKTAATTLKNKFQRSVRKMVILREIQA